MPCRTPAAGSCDRPPSRRRTRSWSITTTACRSAPCGATAAAPGVSQSFWRLPRVEPAGGIGASEPEVADDPERDCRETEAPVEGRFQGPALRGSADPAGRLVVPPLPAQLSRHRGAVPGARSGGGSLHPEPLGPGLCPTHREETAAVPQATLRLDPG